MPNKASRLIAPFALIVAAAFAPAQAAAQDNGHRSYYAYGTPRADTDKSAEQIAREEYQANADAQACDSGNTAACGDLGEAYEYGRGVEQNRPVAAVLYTEACDAEDGQSCYRLGQLTLSALAGEPEPNKPDEIDPNAGGEALLLFDRACTLGSLDGCAALAGQLYRNEATHGGPLRGEALFRETCERGGSAGCQGLALILLEEGRGEAARAEALTLLDKECRAGELKSCSSLISATLYADPSPTEPPITDTLYFACAAGDAVSCRNLGNFAFFGDRLPQDRDYALRLFDEACKLDKFLCTTAENMRAITILPAQCEAGDMGACAKLGQIYWGGGTQLNDQALARQYLEPACEAGQTQACYPAAQLIFADRDNLNGTTADQARQYLELGCGGEEPAACELLAQELMAGERIVQDKPRAYRLYADLCENDLFRACELLQVRFAEDPDVPLTVAGRNFGPPNDPDRAPSYWTEEDQEFLASLCSSSTLTFRGKEYSDRICDAMQAVRNGFDMRRGEAPWQAMIWRPSQLNETNVTTPWRISCGGTLIERNWILTAAHCLTDNGNPVISSGHRIRLGVFNPREREGISYAIQQVFAHPSYNSQTYAYDIALIRIDQSEGRKEGRRAGPIAQIAIDRQPVDARVIEDGMDAFIYGWGLTDWQTGSPTDNLRGAMLQLVNPDRCNEISGYPKSFRDATLCAKGRDDEQACTGDSGGPLIYYGDRGRGPQVIGVVSWGSKCGTTEERLPSVYTRVGNVRGWIDQTIRTNR